MTTFLIAPLWKVPKFISYRQSSCRRAFSTQIRMRIRHHVNPLKARFQQPFKLPNDFLSQVFEDPGLPVHLDIGSGKGRFLLSRGASCDDMNFLGLEIRKPLVIRANDWRDSLGLRNVHFLYCNANVALDEVVRVVGEHKMACVSIQFPDPHFRKRNWKRRIVQPPLVESLGRGLRQGGVVFLQTDVLEVAVEMRDFFDERPEFERVGDGEWADTNPFGIPTDKELDVLGKSLPVYRMIFRRAPA